MSHHLDEIDRRILHALMSDARNTSAPMIAEGLNVSAATVRNRIERLEEEGVIRGYTAIVDFEQADGPPYVGFHVHRSGGRAGAAGGVRRGRSP